MNGQLVGQLVRAVVRFFILVSIIVANALGFCFVLQYFVLYCRRLERFLDFEYLGSSVY